MAILREKRRRISWQQERLLSATLLGRLWKTAKQEETVRATECFMASIVPYSLGFIHACGMGLSSFLMAGGPHQR